MKAWYAQILKDARLYKVPVLFLRYEDLTRQPKKQLEQTMRFLLNVEDIKGTNAERRVNDIVLQETQKTVSYRLKKDPTKCF